LSGTPEKPSKGWDAALNRICTYGLFKTKSSNQSFWLFNLHLDHVGSDARYNSIKLLMDQVKQINEQDYPVFVIGDLNVEPEDEPIKLLKKEYFDSYALSSLKPYGPKGTFNAFNFDKIVERRIDYIFVSKHINQINKYRVIDDSWNFNYPSDHLPVLIHCRL
jgi:endonuclease/exonuclease/phosphatase family metal-dependent hydrolase